MYLKYFKTSVNKKYLPLKETVNLRKYYAKTDTSHVKVLQN